MRNPARRVALVALVLAVAAGCRDAGGDRAGRFCAEVRKDPATITSGVQGTTAANDVVRRFRTLEATAPIAIEDDWGRLTELVELAADVDPADVEARTRLITAAYEADGSVRNVVTWVRGTCGVDLTVPASATTTASASTPPATTVQG